MNTKACVPIPCRIKVDDELVYMQIVLAIPIDYRAQKFSVKVQIVYEINVIHCLYENHSITNLTHCNVDKAVPDNGKEQYAAFNRVLTSNGQPWNITPNFQFSRMWILSKTPENSIAERICFMWF